MALSKSRLAILLSYLEVFEDPSVIDEQYPTDPEIAAEVLWTAYMVGDLTDREVLDLGCGTGVLTLGAALLGAACVGVDADASALTIARANHSYLEEQVGEGLDATFEQEEVGTVSREADTVIQNPPFGTKKKHADREFLERAFAIAPVVWSFHKDSTARFVEKFAEDSGYEITHKLSFDFPIKATMAHHTRRVGLVKVSCWRFVRKS